MRNEVSCACNRLREDRVAVRKVDPHQVLDDLITVENVKKSMGLDITIVTTATTDEEGRELLKLLGMPFRRTEPAAPTKTQAA